MPLLEQVVYLFILAIPIACVAWTVTHEEVFREPREFCQRCSQTSRRTLIRKFFYLFTCEYCFSHWVTALALIVTGYHLLYTGWRGYLIAFFSLPFVANIYLGIYGQVKLGVTKDRVEIKAIEAETKPPGPKLEKPAA